MTYAQNFGNEKTLSELLFYQMMKQAVSTPGFINNFYNDTFPSYLLFRNQQNFQFLPAVHFINKQNNLITTREQILLISAFFGLSKTKLGEILGVSRQTIYNWYNNNDIAEENNDKIRRLADIANEVDPEPSQQIFHVYANDIIDGYEKSLINYLLDDDFDEYTVVNLSKTIYEMSKERWKRIDSMPKAKYGLTEAVR